MIVLGVIRHAWTQRRLTYSNEPVLRMSRFISFHLFHMDGCFKRKFRRVLDDNDLEEKTRVAEWTESLGQDVEKLEMLNDSSRAHSDVLKAVALDTTRKLLANHIDHFSQEDVYFGQGLGVKIKESSD